MGIRMAVRQDEPDEEERAEDARVRRRERQQDPVRDAAREARPVHGVAEEQHGHEDPEA
jgi:hypothetical protein